MATITISSNDLTAGGLIPPLHKGSSCNQGNINPQFSWVINGFTTGHILDYDIYIIDLTASGNGPGGKFIYWGVEGISNTLLNVAQSQVWTGGETILPSDYGSGDASNGYNGPCAPTAIDNNYQIYVRANIAKESQFFVGATEVVGLFRFTDNNTNLEQQPNSGDCGELGCPPGYTLIEGLCQLIETTESILNETTYTASSAAASIAWGVSGTRFYADADTYVLPLRGGQGGSISTDAILEENNGLGSALPFTLVNTTPLWDGSANPGTDGRLAIAGIWPVENPTGQWIGFSECLNVETTKKYCIGIAADNRMRIKINGTMLAKFEINAITAHFNFWHVIEVTLNAGNNIIEIEGYNEGSAGGFAAEIYNADIPTLSALSTPAELEPYIIFTTRDQVGEVFDIGEQSGYSCPNGFSYDSCNNGECVKISFTDSREVECCYIIENCKDPTETYAIQFAEGEPDIYQDTVYAFSSAEGIFADKCFKVIDYDACPEGPDFSEVMVVTEYGLNNCAACDPSQEFQSCTNPEEILYVAFDILPTLIVGNVYALSIGEGCYTYVGERDDQPPLNTGVTITTDYSTDYCDICTPCYVFTSCLDGETEIRVRFAEGQPEPILNGIYELGDDEAITNQCWQYTGTDTCDTGDEDYLNVVIALDYKCDNCRICNPRYLLTKCGDCTIPESNVIIEWSQTEDPLDLSNTYVFDFAPETCYTMTFIPRRSCEELDLGSVLQLNTSNILETYTDCETCTKTCYRLVDCETNEVTHYSEDSTWATYVGKILRWQTQAVLDAGSVIEYNCSKVESYVCRLETYSTLIPNDLVINSCYRTCDECETFDPVEPEEEIITGRKVAPDYNVPECNRTPKNNCESC